MKLLRLPIIVVLVAGVFFGCQSNAAGPDSSGVSRPRQKAPPIKLVDLDKKPVVLEQLKGNVVFLDFWATWCPPCVQSSPQIEQIVQDYKSKKLVVLSLSLDEKEEMVRRFLKTHKMTSRVALIGDSGVEQRYSINGIPAFFIVDKEGYVVKAWEGYHPSMPGQWRKEIDRLLGT